MTRAEEDFILNRINGAFAKGPSNFHKVTPELLKQLERERLERIEQKRRERERK